MGQVWRARDTRLKRDVALKLLPPAFIADADRLARFQREAELLAALNHPNIAQVYGFEREDEQTAIVMELVDGPTLAEKIHRGPIAPDEAMAIAIQVLAALEAAHAKQIVHRDLKPANIKLGADGRVKVLDFGISKPIDPNVISGGSPVMTTPAMTQTGVILGTAAYMSPEQARGRFVDQRTDIWAFGCLLFEMLTGQPAFGGEDVMLTLARVLDRDTDLSSIPGTISPAVRHTIRLCLEKDPRWRIADVRDVRLALEGRFESERLQTDGSGSVAQGRRRWLMPAGALAAGVLLAAVIALVLWPEAPAPRLSRWVHVAPPDRLPDLVADVPVLAIAPDGSEFSYASSVGLVRRPLAELESRVIPGTETAAPIAPHYSADGRSLVYASVTRGALHRIGIEGGTPVELLNPFPNYGWEIGADGNWYGAMSTTSCVVARIAPTGGASEVVFERPEILCVEPRLLPDGRHLLAQTAPAGSPSTGPWSVSILELTSMSAQALFPGQMPTIVDQRYLVYFEPTLGLTARAFNPASFQFGGPVPLIGDVLTNAQGNAAHFRVSPGGTLVYVSRGSSGYNGAVMARMDPDGRIEPLDIASGDIRYPAYSPDGTRLLLQQGGLGNADPQIWLHDISGETEPRQLTFDGRNGFASWSADGAWVTFTSDRGDGTARIWRQRADGRGTAEALTDPAEATQHLFPIWAPDGRLVYVAQGPGIDGLDAYIVAIPDGEPELFLGGAGNQMGVAFSPDRKAVAYESAGTIFVEPFPREAGTRRQVSRNGEAASWPVWSSNGNRLAFRSGPSQFGSVEIDTTSFAIRDRREVAVALRPALNERMIDAIPGEDGWLVIVSSAAGENSGGAAAEIIVVEGWLAELDARVPPL